MSFLFLILAIGFHSIALWLSRQTRPGETSAFKVTMGYIGPLRDFKAKLRKTVQDSSRFQFLKDNENSWLIEEKGSWFNYGGYCEITSHLTEGWVEITVHYQPKIISSVLRPEKFCKLLVKDLKSLNVDDAA